MGIKLNSDVKKKWVAALRSGKYAQATGGMRRRVFVDDKEDKYTTGYCCLGVLQHLYSKEKKTAFKCATSDDTYPTKGACEWANISERLLDEVVEFEENGTHFMRERIRKNNLLFKLACFNDDGRSFKWIASYIERYL